LSQGEPPPLIQAMLRADFYPHASNKPELIQTHISWVFLTGEYAYKVKKPVDFGFVDFTTLARRKHFCEQELALNRRLSPELYLDVLSIVERNGDFRLGSRGEAVEYCIKMVEFAQDDLLDRRLAANAFDPAWMDALAHDVADFHAQAETGPEIAVYGDIHFIRDHIHANLAVAEHHLDGAISQSQLDHIRTFCAETLHQKAERVAARQAQGFIRVCHGDLHLRNITLFKGRPRVFDCIEFNDEYRMIDTINDGAFLVMDCRARDRPDLGMRFLSRYLEHNGDYAGLDLLPVYLTYRAGVRGKVACLLADELEPGEAEAQMHEARRYFALADGYARPTPPCLFVIGGLSGSGKSHLALIGAGKEPAIIIRSDATRKRLSTLYPGLPLYGPEMGKRTYDAMFEAAEQTLAAGFSAILDATFLRRQDRDRARDIAGRQHAPCHIIWLDMAEDVLRQRVAARSSQGTDISDAGVDVLDMQLAGYERPTEPGVNFVTYSNRWPENK
jgi:aminoglycoside phosphotransferase family enzyme/predicted kinase